MIDVQSALKYNAPAVAAIVVEFRNDGNLNPYCVVENKDVANSIALKYQESDDGITWTDIAGTTTSVLPNDADGQVVTSAKSRTAVHAGGNADFLFSLVKQANGDPTDLGRIT